MSATPQPCSPASSSASSSSNPSATDPSLLTLLIVDDNELNLRLIRQILSKKFSHLVHLPTLCTASSGPQALALLAQYPFHLILLDISMPGMSGLEVCRRLRDPHACPQPHSPQPPILACNRQIDVCAVTTDLEDWQVEMYRRAGMNGVIGKPLKEHDLHHALQLALTSVPSRPSLPQPIPAGHATYPFFFRSHGLDCFVRPLALSESTSPPRPTLHLGRKDHSDTSTATIVPTRRSFDGDRVSPSHPEESHLPMPTLGRRTLIQRRAEPSRPGLTRVDSLSSTTTGTSLSEPTSLEAPLVVTVSGPQPPDWSRWVDLEQDPFSAGFESVLTPQADCWAQRSPRRRRSQPILTPIRSHRTADERLSKSACGSPGRPTYQLLWLGKAQSVLRDGAFLEELLGEMELEDRR